MIHRGFFFLRFYLVTFRERERDGEGEGEKHRMCFSSPTPCTGDLAPNPGMCLDWESNQQPFASQAGTQSTEPHQPGLIRCVKSPWVLSGKWAERNRRRDRVQRGWTLSPGRCTGERGERMIRAYFRRRHSQTFCSMSYEG